MLTHEELRALGLAEEQLDAAWDASLADLRAEGVDVDAMIERASANLTAWRAAR